MRARAKYVEQGEKSTAYFLNLEKQRQSFNKITKLKTTDKVVTNPYTIL